MATETDTTNQEHIREAAYLLLANQEHSLPVSHFAHA